MVNRTKSTTQNRRLQSDFISEFTSRDERKLSTTSVAARGLNQVLSGVVQAKH